MLLEIKKFNLKLTQDLSFLHKKMIIYRLNLKLHQLKNIKRFLNLSYTPRKINKTEFPEKLAQSIDYAQSINTNSIVKGDYKLLKLT